MSAIEAEVNANIMEAEPVEVPVPSEVDALDVKEFMKETTHTDSTLPDSHDASAVASATEEGAGQVADNAVEEIANDDTNILTPAHSEGTKVNGDAVPAIETEAASDTMQDASAIPETPIIVTPQDPATSVAEPEHATEQVEQIERPPSPWTPSYSVTTQGLGTPTSEVPPPVAPETTLDATPATEEDAAEELATPAETAELLAEVSDQSDVIPDIKVEDISETTVPPVSEGEVETTDSAPVVVEPEPEVAQDASSSPASATEEVGVEETTGAEVEALLQDTKVDEPEVPSVAEVAAVEDVRGVAPEETAPEAVQAEVETTDSAPVVVEPEPEAAAPAPVSSAEEAVVEETSGAEVEALLQDTNADEPEVPSVAEVAADVEDVREVTPEETSTEAVLAEVETTDSTPVVVEPEPEAAAAAPVSSAEEAVIEETAAAEGEVLIQDTMADEPSVAEVATVDDVHKVTPEETSTEAVLAEVETIDAAPGFVEPEVVSNPSAVDEVVVEETTTPSVGAEVEALIQDTEADEMEVPPAADLVEDVPEAIPAADVVTEDIPVADETAAQEDAVVEDSSATAVPEDQVTTTEAAPVEPATIPTTEDVTPEDPVSAVEEAVVQEALPPSVEAEVAAEETKADVTTDTLSVRHVAEDSTATAVAEEELVKPELHLNDTAVEEILDVAAPEIVSVAENPAFEDESTEEPLRTDVLSTAHEGEVERPKSPWTPSYSVTTQGPGIPTVDELEAADLPVLPPPVEVMAPAPSEEDPVSDGTDLSAFVVAEAEPEAVSSPDIQVEIPADTLSATREEEMERPKSPWTPSYSVTTQGPEIPSSEELETADLPVLSPPTTSEDVVPVAEETQDETTESEVFQEPHVAPIPVPEVSEESAQAFVADAETPLAEEIAVETTEVEAFEDVVPEVVETAGVEWVEDEVVEVAEPAETQPLQLSIPQEPEIDRPKSPWTPSYSVTTQGPEIPSSEELEAANLPVLSPPTTEDIVPVADEETQDETTESEVLQEPDVAPIPVPEVSEESAQASVADAETPLADDIVTVETTGVEASEDVVEAVETAGTEAAEDDVDEVAEPAETQPLQLSIPQEPEIDRPKSPWTPSYTVTTQGPGIPSAEELEAADLPVLSPTEDLTEEVAQDVSLVPTESEPVQEPESVESEHIPAAEAEASLTEVAAGETAGADETIAETADNLSIPQEQEIDRPKSPWTPSYSVTTQGPGIPTSEELEAADLPVLPPPAGESSEDAITTADSATQEDAVAEVESDAVQQEDLVTAAEEVSVVEEAQIAQESVPDVADAVTDDAPGVSQETAASEGVADEETSIAAEAVLDDADVTADQVPAAPVEDAAADIQTTAVDEVSEVSTSVTAEAVPEDADITTDQVREVPADSVEDADVQPIAVDDAVDEVSASVAADETNIVGETVPEDADIAADQVPEVPVDSAEDAEVQPVAVDAVVDEVSASVATDETDIIADQVSEAPVEDAASEPVAADTTVDEVLASVAVDETNVAAEAMPEDADITVDQVFEIPVAADVVEEISTPVAADEVEALTSVEVETPEYAPEELTDESLAVPAGEIERPKSPWTPSYSVTTQGPGIPTAEELEVADLPVLPPPVQIIADTSEPEPTVTVTSVDAETAPSSDPPRPWTPSYSVVVQGSPLSTPVDLVPQEPVSEAVSIDGEVSEAEPSSSPVASLIESGVIVDPATLQDPDVENDSPDPGSEAVVAALIESGVLGDVPQEQIAETTEKMLDDAVTESAATEVDVEVATEEPLVDTVPEPSGGATEVVIPEATSAQEASTLEEIAASEDSVTQDIVEPESSESTTLEALAAGAVVEAEGVAEEPQLLAPREPEIERPKSPWTPSYSVTTQGPGIPTAEELEAADLSTLPPPATEAVAADIEEQQAPTETLVEAPAIVLEDKAPADSLSPQEPEPERPKSPWTPSYSVTTQGPGIPTTEELDAAELPVLPPPVEATAPPAEDTSAFPLVAAGVAAVAATAVIAETAIATTAEHSKREEAEQAKEIPAPAQADESVAEETPASSGEPFVKPPVDEESVSVSVEPPADTPVNDATPIAPPVPLPELRPFPSTLEIPSADAEEVDDLPPVSPRSRLESTASSIFFPGGWFSKVPLERPSLDVAQGEFTPSKPSPPPVPSPSLAAEEQSEEKKGKWCVVM